MNKEAGKFADFRPFQPFLEFFIAIITGVVGDDLDDGGFGMLCQGR